jgi:colanic acid/amylovoran biosynthesis glycosyltransferase
MFSAAILHARYNWLPQTQTWIYNQVSVLQQLGLNVHVACERTENLDQFSVANIHCRVVDFPVRSVSTRVILQSRRKQYLQYLTAIGRRIGAQIVHSHFGDIAWGELGAVASLKCRHVVTFYGYDVNHLPVHVPAWRSRYAELFRSADLILCEGSHMARCIMDLGCPVAKIGVQHLGVDVQGIAFRPRRWEPGDTLRVLMAASFREKKGIVYGIEALGRVARRTSLALTIIGDSGTDSESRTETHGACAQYNADGVSVARHFVGAGLLSPHVPSAECYRKQW